MNTPAWDISDCTAMSEDEQWFAFAKSIPRGRVMAIMAENCGDWGTALRAYTVRAGHVYPDNGATYGTTWHFECDADHPRAIPVWIVRQRVGV